MTRKDYINIADAIRATRARIVNDPTLQPPPGDFSEHRVQQLRGVRRAAASIADALKDDNPQHFDVQLFLTNCGYNVAPFDITDATTSEKAAATIDN